MQFAIRDDDISFWTKVQDLEVIYKEIWNLEVPVSFSVIPFAVKSYNRGDRQNYYQDEQCRALGDNKELVVYLKEQLREKKISIMLHGFSHQYKVAKNKKNEPVFATKINLEKLRKTGDGNRFHWLGEYNWKKYEQLKRETRTGKEYLEDTFHTQINVFVPPSNDISKEGIKAVSEFGLNISGTMLLSKFNRPVNFSCVKNWLIKLWWRIKNGYVYPHIMNYQSHKELCAYGFVPGVTLHDLKDSLDFCFRNNAPFVLATHHWELKKNSHLHDILENYVNFIHNLEMDYVSIDDIFSKSIINDGK
jgi:predicted deacetylase